MPTLYLLHNDDQNVGVTDHDYEQWDEEDLAVKDEVVDIRPSCGRDAQ